MHLVEWLKGLMTLNSRYRLTSDDEENFSFPLPDPSSSSSSRAKPIQDIEQDSLASTIASLARIKKSKKRKRVTFEDKPRRQRHRHSAPMHDWGKLDGTDECAKLFDPFNLDVAVMENGADGNCMFHCIAQGINLQLGTELTFQDIRNVIAIGLTEDIVRNYLLPSIEADRSERHVHSYIRQHGTSLLAIRRMVAISGLMWGNACLLACLRNCHQYVTKDVRYSDICVLWMFSNGETQHLDWPESPASIHIILYNIKETHFLLLGLAERRLELKTSSTESECDEDGEDIHTIYSERRCRKMLVETTNEFNCSPPLRVLSIWRKADEHVKV